MYFLEKKLNRLKSKPFHCDSILLATTIILVLIGLVMVLVLAGYTRWKNITMLTIF